MTEDLTTPAAHAAAVDTARQRLMNFVRQCPDDLDAAHAAHAAGAEGAGELTREQVSSHLRSSADRADRRAGAGPA